MIRKRVKLTATVFARKAYEKLVSLSEQFRYDLFLSFLLTSLCKFDFLLPSLCLFLVSVSDMCWKLNLLSFKVSTHIKQNKWNKKWKKVKKRLRHTYTNSLLKAREIFAFKQFALANRQASDVRNRRRKRFSRFAFYKKNFLHSQYCCLFSLLYKMTTLYNKSQTRLLFYVHVWLYIYVNRRKSWCLKLSLQKSKRFSVNRTKHKVSVYHRHRANTLYVPTSLHANFSSLSHSRRYVKKSFSIWVRKNKHHRNI